MNSKTIDVSHDASFGNLYIVSTPIGNLQDITIRAVNVLFNVDIIACEDTRRTGILLQSISPVYETLSSGGQAVRPRFVSLNDYNEDKRAVEILSHLKNGLDVALVSDSGTPLVSDPGYKLVRECIKEGIKVESIPGPSAVL